MKKTIRKLAALGTAIAATGVAQAAPFHGNTLHDGSALTGATAPLILAAGEGGEGGEGGASVDEDMAFHVAAAEIEGRLTVAAALYAQGRAEDAKAHLVRPADGIYQGLQPLLKEFNAPGFAEELTALADAVEAGAPAEEVEAKLQAAVAGIAASTTPESPHELALTVAMLVRIAGQDFAKGVADGKVTDADEYQDAWGYVQAGKRMISGAPDWMREEYGAEFDKIAGLLDGLDAGWPDLAGEAAPGLDASVIAGAAARIEIVSLRMD